MACKGIQFYVVEQQIKAFKYQFECSAYEWNDSFWFGKSVKIFVWLFDTLVE